MEDLILFIVWVGIIAVAFWVAWEFWEHLQYRRRHGWREKER